MSLITNAFGVEVQTGCCSCQHNCGVAVLPLEDDEGRPIKSVICKHGPVKQTVAKISPFDSCPNWKMNKFLREYKPSLKKGGMPKPVVFWNWLKSRGAAFVVQHRGEFYWFWLHNTPEGQSYLAANPQLEAMYHSNEVNAELQRIREAKEKEKKAAEKAKKAAERAMKSTKKNEEPCL